MANRRVEALSSVVFVHYRLDFSIVTQTWPWSSTLLKLQRLMAPCIRLQQTNVTNAGYGVIVPVTPTLMTDFFASRHSDVYIHCEDYKSHEAPLPCHDAHSDAVNWSSASAFVSNSILSFALVRLRLLCVMLLTIIGLLSASAHARPLRQSKSATCWPVLRAELAVPAYISAQNVRLYLPELFGCFHRRP